MGLQLRTGKNGKNVTSDSDGRLYSSIFGRGKYVFNEGDKLAATMADSNTLTVQSGSMLFNGRHVTLDGTETWTIPNGAQGQKRSNLAVIRYTKDSEGTENVQAVTLSGELATDTPVDPAFNNTSILDNGTTISDFPIYRVITDGINAQTPVKLFGAETAPLAERVSTTESDITSLKTRTTTAETNIANINKKFPVSVANGGTGATTAANARTNLGVTPANIGAIANSDTGWMNVLYKASDSYIKARKVGRTVTVVGTSYGEIAGTSGGTKTLATLASQFRPSIKVEFVGHGRNDKNSRIYAFTIETSGAISVLVPSDNTTSSYWAFSVTYVV